MKMLSPSILASDFSELGRQIKAVEKGGADLIHCDIMDGRFVPNISYGPPIVKTVNRITDLPLDVHLMIVEPEKYIEDFANAGADYITIHQETCTHLHRTLSLIKDKGLKAGVALNPATPVISIYEILHMADLVLVMSVNPGFGGQSFLEFTLKKTAELSVIRKELNLDFAIEMDGGLNLDNANYVLENGCDIIVAGSSVFGTEDITKTTKEFKKIISKY